MQTIRTSYFTDRSPLLPKWMPNSGLLSSMLASVLDNHFQDVMLAYMMPFLMPNYVYALQTNEPPPQSFVVTARLGQQTWDITVRLSRNVCDIYEDPLPFALFDGEWLLLFNLYNGYASGGTAGAGFPYPTWTGGEMTGTRLMLDDHLVGGRALWRVGNTAWRSHTTDHLGLFLPCISSPTAECYYERRPPFPQMRLQDKMLQLRWLWSRGDDVLRLFGMQRRHRSMGSAMQAVQTRLPGIPLFGMASELGLTSFVPGVSCNHHYIPPPGVTGVYSTDEPMKRMNAYPAQVHAVDFRYREGTTNLILLHQVWMDSLPARADAVFGLEIS